MTVTKLRPKPAPAQLPAFKHVPSSLEKAVIDQTVVRPDDAPQIKCEMKDGVGQLNITAHKGTSEESLAAFMKDLALPTRALFNRYMGILAGYALDNDGKLDEERVNFIAQFVVSMKPKDPAETLLLTHMAGVNCLSMMFASRLGRTSELRSLDFYDRTLNKLMRTFTTQMQTLKQYRSNGKQQIIVKHQHVNVNDQAQAIIGDVTQGVLGEGMAENPEATS